jgi:hypothetical protein
VGAVSAQTASRSSKPESFAVKDALPNRSNCGNWNHRALKLYGIGSPPRRRLSVGLLFLAPAGLIFLVFGVAASILVGYVQLVDAFAMTLGGFLIIVGAWYHAAQRKPDV